MEEPVVKASSSSMNLNSQLHQRMISSDRDLLRQAGQMHHAGGDGCGQLDAEITVGHAVQTVGAGGGEAQFFGGELPVQGVGGAGQSARAQGALGVHPAGGVGEPLQIPQ